MADHSKIEWTDATFNPWRGCQKVSPGCTFCYAEAISKRFKLSEWGPGAERKLNSRQYWNKPFAWDRKAEREGVRRPCVLCINGGRV